jgi:hypothetical protein
LLLVIEFETYVLVVRLDNVAILDVILEEVKEVDVIFDALTFLEPSIICIPFTDTVLVNKFVIVPLLLVIAGVIIELAVIFDADTDDVVTFDTDKFLEESRT